jgi:hypothetical protein
MFCVLQLNQLIAQPQHAVEPLAIAVKRRRSASGRKVHLFAPYIVAQHPSNPCGLPLHALGNWLSHSLLLLKFLVNVQLLHLLFPTLRWKRTGEPSP